MTESVLPSDYEPSDGFDAGIDICPHCGTKFHPSDHAEPVYDTNGQKYEYITDTDPGKRPFFCPECWNELEANRRGNENQSLNEYK